MRRHIERVEARTAEFDKALTDPSTLLTDLYPLEPTGEANVTIIDALANDNAGIFQVNVLNEGTIAGIADDIAVEIPAYVSRAGIQNLQLDPLPEAIMHLTARRALTVEHEVQTYLSGSRDRLLLGILADSDMGYDQANNMLDAVLAHPRNTAMAAHFV